MKVRFSITVCQHKSLRSLIEAIPYWMQGAAAVAETV